ncbi:GTP 3',8-cyclase MoaA [Qipengyuania sp. YG27]|uniref:GTP 3',8-cyclase n=1 Tax=Qipengyuania mesophila TaxID=2867246 RepID=A0ABS7JT73_9SPHN|nr:GTP 3',8-cyclase MoaA [Qipengyuania mesophila]MBX7500846.1 GTP 3',8-cyclase MoaA [Qipengyuania mesophila]
MIVDRLVDYLPVSGPLGPRLRDGLGRRFEYLRLSLTEVCNFRCTYCLPDGYRKRCGQPSVLSLTEIERAVRAFAALGLWKVRLTGGEPTIRHDFEDVARAVSTVPGIRRVAMTTNGYRLAERAQSWRDAGVDALNISVDSLDPARFAAITGHDRLAEVLAGIDAAREAGFSSIKLNAVLMRGVNDDELEAMTRFVATRDLSLRFIEVMRTNDNAEFFAARHVSGESVARRLEAAGWQRLAREAGAGPAVEFGHAKARGRIGIIAPYAKDFCASCNRLRLGSDGKFHLCLFGDGGFDLRPLLQHDDQHDELVARIVALTRTKAPAHRLHDGDSGATPHLASIGG